MINYILISGRIISAPTMKSVAEKNVCRNDRKKEAGEAPAYELVLDINISTKIKKEQGKQ